MRFLVDECTGPAVASWLHQNGHEVFSVFEEARGMNDDDIIQKAAEDNWILITNDKDFGDKVFRDRHLTFMKLPTGRDLHLTFSSKYGYR